ncbi:MAG: reverse transcriptase-like protein [Thaumarchaeota archaeon]|nr:MAG: reverse transcriptase-like protein [Nitrososphaerota archaeon]
MHGRSEGGGATRSLRSTLTASVSEPRNPGTGAYGYVVYDSSGKIAEGNDVVGDNVSNNYAEYSALVAALNELLRRGLTRDVTVKSDSKLLVNQMSGKWRRKKGGYLEKYKEASELAKKFERSRVAYQRYRRSKGLPVRFSH